MAEGRSNDVAKLAFLEAENAEEKMEQMDLTELVELKRSEKGAVEVKLVDRLRALELLLEWTEEKGEDSGRDAAALYDALEASAGEQRTESKSDSELLPQTASGDDLVV
jgi:hypothetical protein